MYNSSTLNLILIQKDTGTLVGGSVTYNLTAIGYIVPAGASYTFTSECGGAYSFSIPAPALPTAPGPVTASINSATQKLALAFTPPADLTVSVNKYIVSISTDNGVTWRKVSVDGSGAEIPYLSLLLFFLFTLSKYAHIN